jgi:hypothetical protein
MIDIFVSLWLSQWDNIELSDDESDCHPNIDKQSWFRMKHRARVEVSNRCNRNLHAWILTRSATFQREDREDVEKTGLTKVMLPSPNFNRRACNTLGFDT